MSANTSIIFYIFICYSILSIINGLPVMTLPDSINDNEIYMQPYINHQAFNKIFRVEPSVPPTNIQRRNVLMPRICYFSRVTASGIHRKLCLPYNDER
ncbi:hypothetical protein I4U23_008836 [Adineta vaga]|nr:hypothetical protein I4U23_008836 [Adineta vaga]